MEDFENIENKNFHLDIQDLLNDEKKLHVSNSKIINILSMNDYKNDDLPTFDGDDQNYGNEEF